MIVTFPHLGPLSIALSQMFNYLDIPHVIPPENGEKALAEGSAISPEEICLPFKYMAGNLKQAYYMGADTALMVATDGPCRLGEYGELLKVVLDRAGCKFTWILLDTPSAIGLSEMIKRIRSLFASGGAGSFKIFKSIIITLILIRRIDHLRTFILQRAGYLKNPREATKLLKDTEEKLNDAGTYRECFSIIKHAQRKLENFARQKETDPIKILIVGEIYTSIEPEANGNLENMLIDMGCSIKRHIDISWWLRRTFMPHRNFKNTVGGYARETMDEIMNDRWSDGIIKIMPSGCMPEIVTKGLCQDMSENGELKIMNLIYDEMRGSAGYKTRVEAFVDMLERRRDVLAGDRHRVDKYRYGIDE